MPPAWGSGDVCAHVARQRNHQELSAFARPAGQPASRPAGQPASRPAGRPLGQVPWGGVRRLIPRCCPCRAMPRWCMRSARWKLISPRGVEWIGRRARLRDWGTTRPAGCWILRIVEVEGARWPWPCCAAAAVTESWLGPTLRTATRARDMPGPCRDWDPCREPRHPQVGDDGDRGVPGAPCAPPLSRASGTVTSLSLGRRRPAVLFRLPACPPGALTGRRCHPRGRLSQLRS